MADELKPTRTTAPAGDPAAAHAAFVRGARYLAEHPAATWVDLLNLGLMESEALLAPERILCFPVDDARQDLVSEFRRGPLGPHSPELSELLWILRSHTPSGRYVCREVPGGGWQVIRLGVECRPHWEPLPGADFQSREDAEWAMFALRWRDQTGQELPLHREEAR
jgi:hypothetical protein